MESDAVPAYSPRGGAVPTESVGDTIVNGILFYGLCLIILTIIVCTLLWLVGIAKQRQRVEKYARVGFVFSIAALVAVSLARASINLFFQPGTY